VGSPECIVDKEVTQCREPPDKMAPGCLFRFHRQVLLGIETDILKHQDIAGLQGSDRLPGIMPEYIVDIFDRPFCQLLEFLGVHFERGKIFLPRPALVGDDHQTALPERLNGRDMLPEPLVIEDRVGGGIDGGVQVKPQEHGLPRTGGLSQQTDRSHIPSSVRYFGP